MIEHPPSRGLYMLAWLGVWSTSWFAILCLGIIAIFAFRWPWLLMIALPTFLVSQIAFIALAFFFRCPSCGHFVFIQGWRPMHPARKRVLAGLGIASWIAVAVDIARNRQFTCMHCGERCTARV
jgi:predicted RNA-binding Zn-ribbon protein involved in translation (DUF1610 family)